MLVICVSVLAQSCFFQRFSCRECCLCWVFRGSRLFFFVGQSSSSNACRNSSGMGVAGSLFRHSCASRIQLRKAILTCYRTGGPPARALVWLRLSWFCLEGRATGTLVCALFGFQSCAALVSGCTALGFGGFPGPTESARSERTPPHPTPPLGKKPLRAFQHTAEYTLCSHYIVAAHPAERASSQGARGKQLRSAA